MDTISKLYRYLVIHEAYDRVLTEAGKMAKGLSRDYIYGEIEKITHIPRRTIQRALSYPRLTVEQIECKR